MDADILRLILFLAGVALILGTYFWDRHKKINERVHAIRRAQQEASVPETPLTGELPEAADPGAVAAPDEPAEALEQELHDLGELLRDQGGQVSAGSGEQVEFSFSADPDLQEPLPADLPELILQVNLRARNGQLGMDQISQAATEVGLEYGDMKIFHRYEPESGGRVSFSMANLVNPGTFPDTPDSEFRSPGLTLFAQLPGPKDGLAIFSDMLFTAQRLASLLDAQLQDEHHSDLSKQTIEHMREEILEHRRKLQLARSRA